MGSSLCTVVEAAARLRRTRRMIFKYIEKGFLTRTLRDGKVLLSRDEVEQLSVELGSDLPALTRHNLFQLQSRVKRLEEQMALVQEVWGSGEKPLRLGEKEAASLHKAATDYLCETAWSLEQIRSWAQLFQRFDEETLETIAAAALTMKPWEVFFDLASRMFSFIAGTKDIKKSLELQLLQNKVELGRRRIREGALMWIERGRGTIPNHVFKLFDTPEEDLLRGLTRTVAKAAPT